MTYSQVTEIVSYTSQRIHTCEPGSHGFKMSNSFLLFNKPAENLITYIWEIHRRVNTLICYQIYACVKPPCFTFLHHRELKDIMQYCTWIAKRNMYFPTIYENKRSNILYTSESQYMYIYSTCNRHIWAFWHPKSPATRLFFQQFAWLHDKQNIKTLQAGL